MPSFRYREGNEKDKTKDDSNVYGKPSSTENLLGYFQQMETENRISQKKENPEATKRANQERLRKVFRIKMGREAIF
jgi:hypothetical protein